MIPIQLISTYKSGLLWWELVSEWHDPESERRKKDHSRWWHWMKWFQWFESEGKGYSDEEDKRKLTDDDNDDRKIM